MADMQIIALFCTLYSGIVVSSLWIAVAEKREENLKAAVVRYRSKGA